MPITVIIPAALPSKENSHLGHRSLLDIFGKSLLLHQINTIRSALPDSRIIVVTDGDPLIKKACSALDNVLIVENLEWAETGPSYSIAKGISKAENDNVLVVYGDLVFTKKPIVDAVGEEKDSSLLVGFHQQKSKAVGVISENGLAKSMEYGLPYSWLQIAFFTNNTKKVFAKEALLPQRKTWLFHETMNKVLDKTDSVRLSKTKSIVKDIDSLKQYKDILEG